MAIIQPSLFALKTCATCGIEQPSTEYYRDSSQPDGIMASCRSCRRVRWAVPIPLPEEITIPLSTPSTPETLEATKKLCPICEELKSVFEFAKDRHGNGGRSRRCLECHKAYNRQRYASDPSVRDQERFRHKQKKYGITREQYEALLGEQNGVCAICLQVATNIRGFHVDHDHKTGTVRGLLCSTCNSGIGHLQDDPDLLEIAAAYLRKHKNQV